MKKKALVIFFNKVEEIEAIAPVDVLRRANVEVTMSSLENTLKVIGRSGITIETDALFESIQEKDFDAVILSGGAGVFDIIETPEKFAKLENFFKRHINNGKLVGAICAAPLAFEKMGILKNASAAHHSVASMIPSYSSQDSTVCDGNIITSRGAGTAVEFGLKILSALLGEDTAEDIAKSICFK